jgi:hypothetical protein
MESQKNLIQRTILWENSVSSLPRREGRRVLLSSLIALFSAVLCCALLGSLCCLLDAGWHVLYSTACHSSQSQEHLFLILFQQLRTSQAASAHHFVSCSKLWITLPSSSARPYGWVRQCLRVHPKSPFSHTTCHWCTCHLHSIALHHLWHPLRQRSPLQDLSLSSNAHAYSKLHYLLIRYLTRHIACRHQ